MVWAWFPQIIFRILKMTPPSDSLPTSAGVTVRWSLRVKAIPESDLSVLGLKPIKWWLFPQLCEKHLRVSCNICQKKLKNMWAWQPVILNEDWRGTLVVKKQKEERILYRIRDRTSDQGNIPSNGKCVLHFTLTPGEPAKTKFLHASTLLPSRPQINTCATEWSTIHRWYNPRITKRLRIQKALLRLDSPKAQLTCSGRCPTLPTIRNRCSIHCFYDIENIEILTVIDSHLIPSDGWHCLQRWVITKLLQELR